MRIIAGRLKGRRLVGPGALSVRPTSDPLRETLFNVLGDRVQDARVLDAFAGTGAIGLEALSRGAILTAFIERDPGVGRILARNVAACGEDEACIIIRDDFVGSRARHPRIEPFHVVIADPPYDRPDLDPVALEGARWLRPEGWLVLEHSRRRSTPEAAGPFRRLRTVVAGDSALSFYGTPAEPRM